MKSVWKAFALFLAAMVLCSCSILRESEDLSGLPSLEPQQSISSGTYEPYRATLYYLDMQRNTLSAEIREIELASSIPKATQVFQALFDGPRERGLNGFGINYTFDGVEITGGIANIYLSTRMELSDRQKLTVCAALANTAIDNLGVSYANIFLNDEPVYVAGKPCGLFGKTDLDMTAFYDSYMAKIAEPVWSILVALYFLDDSCDYMVPEARTLSFEGDNYMEEILYQLSLGPANKSHLTSPLRSNYAFTYQGEAGRIGTGGILYIDSVQALFPNKSNISMRQHMACLYYSFHGIMQDLKGMEFSRGLEKTYVTFSIAQLYLGEEILVYFPGKDLRHLEGVYHIVRAGRAQVLTTYVEELAGGPSLSESASVLPCFPEDMGSEGFKSIEMRGNTALVDFSAEMLYSLEGLQEDELYLFLYSVVNTLCETDSVSAVQFSFEGEIVDELGRFSLAMPLYPNIGLVQ